MACLSCAFASACVCVCVCRAGKPAAGLHLDVVKNGSVLQVHTKCTEEGGTER